MTKLQLKVLMQIADTLQNTYILWYEGKDIKEHKKDIQEHTKKIADAKEWLQIIIADEKSQATANG